MALTRRGLIGMGAGALAAGALKPAQAITAIYDNARSGSFTPEMVESDRSRLEGMLLRTHMVAHNADVPTNATWTIADTNGGLLFFGWTAQFARNNAWSTPEVYLWASTNRETELLDNPDRMPLSSVSITRNHLNSGLVPATDARAFGVIINPTLDTAATPDPKTMLYIDNVVGGTPTDSNPGRGLDPILPSTHQAHSTFDTKLYQILAKTLRPIVGDNLAHSITPLYDTGLIIYRGEQPATYRADAYAWDGKGALLGRMGVDFRLTFDGADKADYMFLELNAARTTIKKTAALELTHPHRSGEQWDPLDPGANAVLANRGLQERVGSYMIDLLGDTQWYDWLHR